MIKGICGVYTILSLCVPFIVMTVHIIVSGDT